MGSHRRLHLFCHAVDVNSFLCFEDWKEDTKETRTHSEVCNKVLQRARYALFFMTKIRLISSSIR